jgi:hypothetical protein
MGCPGAVPAAMRPVPLKHGVDDHVFHADYLIRQFFVSKRPFHVPHLQFSLVGRGRPRPRSDFRITPACWSDARVSGIVLRFRVQ